MARREASADVEFVCGLCGFNSSVCCFTEGFGVFGHHKDRGRAGVGGGRASVSRTGRWHSGLFSPQVDTPDFIQEMQEFRSLAYSRLAQARRARFDPRAVDPRCPFRTVACLQEVFAGIRNVATCSGWLGKSHQKAAGGWRRMAKKHRGCSREERCNVKIQYYDLAWRYVRPSAFSRLIISCFPLPKQNIAPFTCQRPLHNTLLILF